MGAIFRICGCACKTKFLSNRRPIIGIFDSFTGAAENDAAGQQIAGINAGLGVANKAFGTGSNDLFTDYTAALQPLQQNLNTAQGGVSELGNLLGLGGTTGNNSALATLQATPGYQFALDQGSQNQMRNQASTGVLGSGQTQAALQTLGQNQAQSTWGSLVSALEPYLGASATAASGVAGVDTGLGNALNANQTNKAALNYQAQTDIGNADANATLGTANADASLLTPLTQLFGGALGGISGATGAGAIGSTAANAGTSLTGAGYGLGSALNKFLG